MSAVPAIRSPWRSRTERRPALRVVSGTRVRPRLSDAAILFVVVGGMAFFSSSLLGHVMVEKARREGISARARALDARKAETLLRSRIDGLTSLASVEGWAHAHGFVAPDGIAGTSEP
jgi:hypothetical protein